MSKEQLETIKKEHEASMATTQNLQGQINGIDQQAQQMARKRQDLVDQLNQAATRTVELQGIIKFLQSEAGTNGPGDSKSKQTLISDLKAPEAKAEAVKAPEAPAA